MRTAPLVLLVAACATARPAGPTRLEGGGAPRFIEDDYEGARALARARRLPLFVDTWAPW